MTYCGGGFAGHTPDTSGTFCRICGDDIALAAGSVREWRGAEGRRPMTVAQKVYPMTDSTPLVEHVANCVQLWWMTQKHEPMHRDDAVGIARSVLDNSRAAGNDELRKELADLRQQRLMILAAVYAEAPRFVATICDEKLDRSGALLGEVRELSRAAIAPTQEPEQ